MQGEDANGDEAITPDEAPVTEMSGLEVVDDTTFTVKLTGTAVVVPDCGSATRRSRRCPSPSSRTPTRSVAKPVGSGPFMVTEYTENSSIELTAYEDYAGEIQTQDQGHHVQDLR